MRGGLCSALLHWIKNELYVYMIYESGPWRKLLLEHVNNYRTAVMCDEELCVTDQQLFDIEKMVFIDAFAIRKLIEAKKIITKTEKMPVELNKYPRSDSQITKYNWIDLDKHYKRESNQTVSRGIYDVCNNIIHSYIFLPIVNVDKKLDGLYFSSDKTKEKHLYFIKACDWCEAVESVANSWPNSQYWRFDDELGEIIVNE